MVITLIFVEVYEVGAKSHVHFKKIITFIMKIIVNIILSGVCRTNTRDKDQYL